MQEELKEKPTKQRDYFMYAWYVFMALLLATLIYNDVFPSMEEIKAMEIERTFYKIGALILGYFIFRNLALVIGLVLLYVLLQVIF